MPLLLHTLRALRTLRRDPQFVSLAFLTLVAITGGTVFYWLVEGLRAVDALYFSVTTLTTVGYGDFSPQTDAGKLFTVFYVLFGVGLLLSFLTTLAGQVVQSHATAHAARNGRTREATRDTTDSSTRRRP